MIGLDEAWVLRRFYTVLEGGSIVASRVQYDYSLRNAIVLHTNNENRRLDESLSSLVSTCFSTIMPVHYPMSCCSRNLRV
jgi:hypothetical protein